MTERDISIVTGSSKGIGKGIALKLAKENHNVMLFGRDVSALKDVQKEVTELGVEAEYFVGDVADFKFAENSVGKILKKYGRVDHLINNAGVGILKKFVDSNLEEFQKQINTNIIGVYNFTKCVIDSMIEKKSGSIINIASLAGKNSFVGGTMYSATKHALLGFTRSLMLEVREYNIKVASVCPGSVYTDFHTGPTATKKMLTVDDVAEAVNLIIKLPVNALASEIDLRPTNPKG